MKNCIRIDDTFESFFNLENLPRLCDLDEIFELHFIEWRKARIAKLLSILGEEWFVGKKVLELGCGFGHIGHELKKYNARVTFAEGREEFIDRIRQQNPGSDIYLLDNDLPWEIDDRFDLIIHWGLLYHLKNWKQDLTCCLSHSPLICLETEVVDSDDKTLELQVCENHYDASLHHVGTRPSVASIESFLTESGCRYRRHDDKDLNASYMVYDWAPGSFAGQWQLGYRRFWMIERPR